MAWTTKKQTGTKHKLDCKMSFGRKDSTCPRCQELLKGSESRKSWDYYKKSQESNLIQAIKIHNCQEHGCLSGMCVTFDY